METEHTDLASVDLDEQITLEEMLYWVQMDMNGRSLQVDTEIKFEQHSRSLQLCSIENFSIITL